MAQIFHRSANFIARASLLGVAALAGIALTAVLVVARAPYITNQRVTRTQPAQFSRKHPVGAEGVDCRYCHTTAGTSAFPGIPPTNTCMTCHSALFHHVG